MPLPHHFPVQSAVKVLLLQLMYPHKSRRCNSFHLHRYQRILNAVERQNSLYSVLSLLTPYVQPKNYDKQSDSLSDIQYPAIYMQFQIQAEKLLPATQAYLLSDVLYSCGKTQNFRKNRKCRIFPYLYHPVILDINAFLFRSSARTWLYSLLF